MSLVLITGPATEPVSVEEAKAHLRVDFDEDDELIAGLITAARQWVEEYTRRALLLSTWEVRLDGWPRSVFSLPRPPLASVVSITGTDEAGAATVASATTYLVDTASEPGRVFLKAGQSWPATEVKRGGCAIRFTAGFASALAVPEVYKQAIKMLVGHLYENREEVVQGGGMTVSTVPMGAKMLLWPWRMMRWEG